MSKKKLHVKTGDTVYIRSGNDHKHVGKVLEVSPREGKIIVEGANMVKKHLKPRMQGEQGSIVDAEAPMYASKAQLVCPKCEKPTRLAHSVVDGKKKRLCKHCGETF